MAQKPSLLAAQAMLRAKSEDAPLPGRHGASGHSPKGSPPVRARAAGEELQEWGGEYRDSPLGRNAAKDPPMAAPFKPSILDMKAMESLNGTRDERHGPEEANGSATEDSSRGAPAVYQRAAPRPGVHPRHGLKEAIMGGRARVNAPKGSRTAIVLEIGGDSLAAELSILEEEGCDTDELRAEPSATRWTRRCVEPLPPASWPRTPASCPLPPALRATHASNGPHAAELSVLLAEDRPLVWKEVLPIVWLVLLLVLLHLLEISAVAPSLALRSPCLQVLRTLYDNLAKYKRVSCDEMQQTVYENYELFIRHVSAFHPAPVTQAFAHSSSSCSCQHRPTHLSCSKTQNRRHCSVHVAGTRRTSLCWRGSCGRSRRSSSRSPRCCARSSTAPASSRSAARSAWPSCKSPRPTTPSPRGRPRPQARRRPPGHPRPARGVPGGARDFPQATHLLAQGEGGLAALACRASPAGRCSRTGTPSPETLDCLEVELREHRLDLMGLLANHTRLPAISTRDLQDAVATLAALRGWYAPGPTHSLPYAHVQSLPVLLYCTSLGASLRLVQGKGAVGLC